jgi:hypothetical protein
LGGGSRNGRIEAEEDFVGRAEAMFRRERERKRTTRCPQELEKEDMIGMLFDFSLLQDVGNVLYKLSS